MYLRIKMWLLNNKLAVLLIIVSIIAVSSAAYNWFHPQIKTLTRTEYQTVEKEKTVVQIKTVKVPGPREVVTIEKPVIVERLSLPPEVATDPAQVITGNADIEPSESGTSVVSVLNVDTGETVMIAKEKPQSLFGFPADIESGIRYGLSTRTLQEGDIYARWQFLRVGKVFLGVYGEISTQPEARAMLDLSYRW
jgi:hypothetical protein